MLEFLVLLPINLTSATINVDFRQLTPAFTLPDPASDVECDDDKEGKIGLEEVVCSQGRNSGVELIMWLAMANTEEEQLLYLCDKNQDNQG